MDGLVRAIGFGIGWFFDNAVAAVGNAINAAVGQVERFLPGGALPLFLVGLVVIVLGWNVLRH